MLPAGIEYGIRALWTGAGLCAVTLGALGEGSWEGRVLVMLSGIVTLLLSILLGGFVKHLAEHQDYNQTLERRLNGKADRLFDVLRKTEEKLDQAQTRQQCDLVQRFFTEHLAAVDRKLDALLQRHPDKDTP
jgi:hypothetical protein